MDCVLNHSRRRNLLIGECIIFDALEGTLRDSRDPAVVVHVKPVNTRVLQQFVDEPRTVLRRQQMIDHNWRRYGMEVCENSLNQAVYSLREALRTLDPSNDYIKTLPRIGYVLIADVSERKWQAAEDVLRDDLQRSVQPEIPAAAPA